jgi:phage protein U
MPTNWRLVGAGSDSGPPYLTEQTTDPGEGVLMQWGTIQFKVWPLNFHEIDHYTETDWAQKEIVGAAIYREWVGENDETIHIRGRIFPYRIGGMTELEHFESMRRAGMPNTLIRGGVSGMHLGWFICTRLVRQHTFISAEGIGQMISFEATMVRVPIPGDQAEFANQSLNTSGAV